RECVQLLDIAFPVVARAGKAGACLATLRTVAARIAEQHGADAVEPLRAALVEALRQGPARELPDPEAVLKHSTIEDRLKPLLPAEAKLARRFGKYVTRAVLDDECERVDRARAGLYFARWFPERSEEWAEVLRKLWERGLSISDLSGELEQAALLEVSHRVGV